MRAAICILLLLSPMLAGCFSTSDVPQVIVDDPDPDVGAAGKHVARASWDATYSIQWSPAKPVEGEPFRVLAARVDGSPPQDPAFTWYAAGGTWSGQQVEWVLPAGDHPVRLEIQADGIRASSEAVISVLPVEGPPASEALAPPEPPKILVEQQANRVDLSLDWSFQAQDVVWYLGDEQVRQGPEVTYLYPELGTYTVTVQVRLGETRYDARTEITVSDVPLAAVYSFQGDTASFAMSWGRDVDQVVWDFGDGRSGSGRSPQHRYDGPGPWQARMTATSGGEQASLDLVVEAERWPIQVDADIDGPDAVLRFTWGWQVDNATWTIEGQTYHGPEAAHQFTDLGLHMVGLTLQGEGREQSVLAPVLIERVGLVIEAQIDKEFVDFSYQWGPTPTAVAWDFDSNGIIDSTEDTPTHAYPRVGKFRVTLTVERGEWSETTQLRIEITDYTLRIEVEPILYDGIAYNEFNFDFDWGRQTASIVTWTFPTGTKEGAPVDYTFFELGPNLVELEVIEGEKNATAAVVVDVLAKRPYFIQCGDVRVAETAPTHGSDAWNGLAWAAVKTGFRAGIGWHSPDRTAAGLEYKIGGGPWEVLNGSPGRGAQAFILDGLPVGEGFCFRPIQNGEKGPLHGMWLLNGPTSWDDRTQTYTINTLGVANEGASRAAIAAGIPWYSEVIWNATDGYVATGNTLMWFDDAEHNDGGRRTCTGHNVLGGDSTPGLNTCQNLFDVVFAYDVENPNVAANANLDGIQSPGAKIWMSQSSQARGGSGPEAGGEVGSVLAHEMGHYAFGMQDMYSAQGQGPDCFDPVLLLSVMGVNRAAREFDDEVNRCPNEIVLEQGDENAYIPAWTALTQRYGSIPQRYMAPVIGPFGTGPWAGLHMYEVGHAVDCTSITMCDN